MSTIKHIDLKKECLTRDVLLDILMRVYIREIDIEFAADMIMADIDLLKEELEKRD